MKTNLQTNGTQYWITFTPEHEADKKMLRVLSSIEYPMTRISVNQDYRTYGDSEVNEVSFSVTPGSPPPQTPPDVPT